MRVDISILRADGQETDPAITVSLPDESRKSMAWLAQIGNLASHMLDHDDVLLFKPQGRLGDAAAARLTELTGRIGLKRAEVRNGAR
jgi:hypothetical protein